MRVLVTGASRGIGLALVQAYVARGDEVVATVRGPAPDTLASIACPRLVVVPLDVASETSVKAAAAAVSGHLDVLISNAGMTGGPQRAPGMDLARAAAILDTNAMGPLRVYDAFADHLRAGATSGRARLVHVSSEAGSLGRFRASKKPEYAMSKAALNALTRWVAAVEPSLVCVSLDPGWTATRTGGDGATFTPEQTAARLVAAIDRLGPEHSGGFYDAELVAIPW